MATKSKRARIPSILIDRTFLQSLGEILEREVRAPGRVSASTKYTFSTAAHEELEFSSMEEVLGTNLLPENVKEFTAIVYHHDPEFVEAHLHLEESVRIFSLALQPTYKISSANEGSLLKVDNDLKRLFDGSRPGYHSFPLFGRYLRTARVFFAGLITLSATYLVFDYITSIDPSAQSRALIPLLFLAIVPASVLAVPIYQSLVWLYPTCEFSLGIHPPMKRRMRAIASLIIGSPALGVLGNILTGLIYR